MVKRVKATLYISEDKREEIRRSGMTLEEYFNKLYYTYKMYSMDKWGEGDIWIGNYRVCLLRAETLNLLLDEYEEKELLDMGRSTGEESRAIMKYYRNLEPVDRDSRLKMNENLNDFSGWGNFKMNNNTILIAKPIFTKPYFLQGYLESLLNLKLKLIESYPDRIAFKIEPETQVS